MRSSLVRIAILILGLTVPYPVIAQESIGWSPQGGKPWRDRLGPGIEFAFGGNDCTGEFCDDVLDSSLIGSAAGTLGFYWRLVPNLAVYLDAHVAYINTDHNDIWLVRAGQSVPVQTEIKDDHGLLVTAVAGAEAHLPFTGWFEAYLGFGAGFAMLRSKSVISGEGDFIKTLRGVDLELKVGTDFYLFSGVPKLGLGPLFKMGFTIWPTMCIEQEGSQSASGCNSPDAQADEWGLSTYKDTPFLIYLGLAGRYVF